MTEEDFYKLVAILIHFGYQRIPNYRLAWSEASLCYDAFVANVMSRNNFEGLMAFLHIVDISTEQQLNLIGDKLSKIRPLNDHLVEVSYVLSARN